jgi:hypothetical protein
MGTQLPSHLLSAGVIVQSVHSRNTSIVSTTNIGMSAPATDTQGLQILSATITPKFSTSVLLVRANAPVLWNISHTYAFLALFKAGVTNAVAMTSVGGPGNLMEQMFLTYDVVAGGTSAITFNVRMGGSTSSGTMYLNSHDGSNNPFGSTGGTYITVQEVLA